MNAGTQPTSAASLRLLSGVWVALLASGYLVGRLVTDARWSWDAGIVDHVRGTGGGSWLSAMRLFTFLGSPALLDGIFVLAIAGLLLARQRRGVTMLLLASPGVVALEHLLKHLVDRTRPLGPHLTSGPGASFPSGHTTSSTALYGALALLAISALSSRRDRQRSVLTWMLGGTVFALVACIGASRVYLGVHYPTDVICSWTIAGVWLATVHHVCGRGQIATELTMRPNTT